MADSKAVSSHRGAGVFFGMLLVILSLIILGSAVVTTLASVYFIGWLLLIGGIVSMFQGLFSGSLGAAVFGILGGIFSLVIGFLMISNPQMSAVTLTLLIGVMLMVIGGYRGIVAVFQRTQGWIANLIWGILTFVLGLVVWMQWPVSGLWVIGVFIGIEFLMLGLSALFGLSDGESREVQSSSSAYA